MSIIDVTSLIRVGKRAIAEGAEDIADITAID
jgi:hypothetical protein